jgi:transposase
VIEIAFTEEVIAELQEISANHMHPFVRRKALVLLLKSKAIAHHLIAEIANICENTVRTYLKDYLSDGISSIKTIEFNKPESKLKQFEEVIREYVTKTPPATIKQACVEIGALTGIELKETQMRQYFKSLKIRFRKVAGIPSKAKPVDQKAFFENELQPRLKEAEEGKRNVHFVDAAHFVYGAFFGYLWSFVRIFIPTPSGRQRFNVLGALNAVTKEMLMITNLTYITSTQVCELLEKIATKSIDPIIDKIIPSTVVMDNARYQRCKAVQEKAKFLNIELLFLPPYSPNLNLIERVWKFSKKHCLNSKFYADFMLFKTAISNFFDTMHHTHADELKSLLTLKFQMFNDQSIS